ncbi:MAG: DegV family protein [Candidatus Caccovivens sp.]
MKYKIVTEASVDMPKSFAEENDITILPIEVNFNGDLYPEGLPNDEFYQKLKTTGIIPKTSQPNQYKFETALGPYVNKEDWFVLTIVISSDLAGTIAQAKNAVENLGMKNVYVCDSRVTTFAEGALIIEIVKYINSHPNAQPQEVIDELERLKQSVRLVAVVGDLKYLKQGGRLSSAGYIAATALKIKPIISLDGGKVNNIAKKIGEKANEYMVELANTRDRKYPIYFGHSANPTLIEHFLEKYATALGVDPKNTPIHEIGCVVGTHAGPNCYGLVYFK